mgnify:CR=1 FL=1
MTDQTDNTAKPQLACPTCVPVAKHPWSKKPPVGASQSIISPAQYTPGRLFSKYHHDDLMAVLSADSGGFQSDWGRLAYLEGAVILKYKYNWGGITSDNFP